VNTGISLVPKNSNSVGIVQDGDATRIIMPGQSVFLRNLFPRLESPPKKKIEASHNPGNSSFGVVYANDLARTEMSKENQKFPPGSIIVREKNAAADSPSPDVVVAMVERDQGFSAKTGDGEFFTFDGADLKLRRRRETKSDCAKCHAGAAKTDWVFKAYLK
jgi:hypothetical protein